MTLLSQIMNHKKQKQLIEMQTAGDKLFLQCKQKGIPFFKWNEWIATHIETSLANFEKYRKNRLANIFKRGETKLEAKVEEKKLRQSMLGQSTDNMETLLRQSTSRRKQ